MHFISVQSLKMFVSPFAVCILKLQLIKNPACRSISSLHIFIAFIEVHYYYLVQNWVQQAQFDSNYFVPWKKIEYFKRNLFFVFSKRVSPFDIYNSGELRWLYFYIFGVGSKCSRGKYFNEQY